MTKIFLFCAFLLTSGIVQARVGGSEGTGGGDACENRIMTIRDDLSAWVAAGGGQGLVLPIQISQSAYKSNIEQALVAAKIQCVAQGDQDFPVTVLGVAKICKFISNTSSASITCDFEKFQALNDDDAYVLVHHEFAGIGGIETPRGADSDYSISNQLSAFLEARVIKRLSIHKVAPGASIPTWNPGKVEITATGSATAQASSFSCVNHDGSGGYDISYSFQNLTLVNPFSLLSPNQNDKALVFNNGFCVQPSSPIQSPVSVMRVKQTLATLSDISDLAPAKCMKKSLQYEVVDERALAKVFEKSNLRNMPTYTSTLAVELSSTPTADVDCVEMLTGTYNNSGDTATCTGTRALSALTTSFFRIELPQHLINTVCTFSGSNPINSDILGNLSRYGVSQGFHMNVADAVTGRVNIVQCKGSAHNDQTLDCDYEN